MSDEKFNIEHASKVDPKKVELANEVGKLLTGYYHQFIDSKKNKTELNTLFDGVSTGLIAFVTTALAGLTNIVEAHKDKMDFLDQCHALFVQSLEYQKKKIIDKKTH